MSQLYEERKIGVSNDENEKEPGQVAILIMVTWT